MSTSANTEAAASRPGKRCAACKDRHRQCGQDCVLAPYFPATDPQRYAYVQRVFGASNVARMLENLPVHERARVADTMAMEARRRVQDPVEAAASSPGKRCRCAACKYHCRKCGQDCVLAPYFPATDPQRYACVQRVFGASNVTRKLLNLPVHERARAADAMAMEARRRVQDPVYGCAGIVGRLQGEIRAAQCKLARTQARIAEHAAAAAARAHPAPAVDAQAEQLQHVPAPLQQQQQDADDAFQGLDALLLDLDDYRWDALTRLI